MKKEKETAPHDEIKAYLQVIKERLDKVFFTRPEWRKPRSIKEAKFFIGKIDEVYYPFASDEKGGTKRKVWRKVLNEKLAEMIEEITAAEKTKATIDESRKKFTPEQQAEIVEKRMPGILAALAAPQADNWPAKRIAELKAKVKAARAGSKIARALGITPCVISAVLNGQAGYKGAKRNEWLTKIEAAAGLLIQKEEPAKVDHIEEDRKAALKSMNFGERKNDPEEKALVSLPMTAGNLISSMRVDIKDGRLSVQLTVDVEQAVRLCAKQLAITDDELKITFE